METTHKDQDLNVTTEDIDDSPTVVYMNGTKIWHKDGRCHRDNGPAIVYASGKLEYYKDGNLHRLDGPSIIIPNVEERWLKEGKLHREDGPAIRFADGTRYWYKEGQLHRNDGPAVEKIVIVKNLNKTEIRREWWSYGIHEKTETEYLYKTETEAEELLKPGVTCITSDKVKIWKKDGQLHRDGAPAIYDNDGMEKWYKEGKLHRDGGLPAVINKNGYRSWFQNGNLIKQEHPISVDTKYVKYTENKVKPVVSKPEVKPEPKPEPEISKSRYLSTPNYTYRKLVQKAQSFDEIDKNEIIQAELIE